MWLSTNYDEATMIGASGSSSSCNAQAGPSTPSASPMSLASHFDALLSEEGAGAWPPTPARAESWPSAWRAYHDIALACPAHFVDSDDGLHPQRSKDYLRRRIDDNRQWLSGELSQRVDVDEAMRLLSRTREDGLEAAQLGFLACLAYLAHLYRWGTLPVVSLAQDETELPGMPSEIRRPMARLHGVYDLGTTGGCLWTMTLLNVDPSSGIVHANMRHLAERYPDAWDAERLNAQIFYDMERLAVPFYRAIAAIDEQQADVSARQYLAEGNAALKAAFKHFFDIVREGRIKKDVWMSHAQGAHGWGVDGHDGVSGDHSMLIRTLDAFLAIPVHTVAAVQIKPVPWSTWLASWIWRSSAPEPTLTEVPYSNDYLPRRQVAWIDAVRSANLRDKLEAIAPEELTETVRLLRLWRAAHTKKAVYYEHLDLPERRPMTASGGVGGGVGDGKTEGVDVMIKKLEARLRARIEATK